MFKLLPKEEQLNVGEEPGLLAAVEPFLRGDKAETALDLLIDLGRSRPGLDDGEFTENMYKCAAAIFGSPCFSTIKDIAATGTTIKLMRKAWEVIVWVTCMETERRKTMVDSAGIFALLNCCRLKLRARTTPSP